jgi:hypothetical protein
MPPVGSNHRPDDVNVRAVNAGVFAIQRALNRRFKEGDIKVTGVFDQATSDLVQRFQSERMSGQTPWPGCGPDTAKALFSPDIKSRCKKKGWPDPAVVCGVIKMESNFDPGAVGLVDDRDLGLAQINGAAHPDLSEGERLAPLTAIDFVIDYLANATRALKDEDLAIASYNLGIGGATAWDKAGRPNPYAPAPGAPKRDVNAYIAKIKTGCQAF